MLALLLIGEIGWGWRWWNNGAKTCKQKGAVSFATIVSELSWSFFFLKKKTSHHELLDKLHIE
jgi:predicted negative regulator of RcsB-dependent stress response